MAVVSRPACFIFGWLGAKPYHLARIKTFYDGLGIDCEVYTQHATSLLDLRPDTQSFSRLYDQALQRPVLCHLFSMNGVSAFLKSFADSKWEVRPEINVKALVLDSTPGHVNTALYHRAFSQALFPHSPALNSIGQSLLSALFRLYLSAAKVHREKRMEQDRRIYERPFQYPTLMLGSKVDALIPYDHMMEYAETARKMGIVVETQFWPDSGHIRTYRDHRPEYIALVRNFAKKYFIEPGNTL
jgi:hypothetical protein